MHHTTPTSLIFFDLSLPSRLSGNFLKIGRHWGLVKCSGTQPQVQMVIDLDMGRVGTGEFQLEQEKAVNRHSRAVVVTRLRT